MLKILLMITMIGISVTPFSASWAGEVVADETTKVDCAITTREIVVYPTSLNVELQVDTISNTTMTISNPGNGQLDFDISIPVDVNFAKVPNFRKDSISITSDTGISNFYGKFALYPPSERPIRGSQPKSLSLLRDEAIIHYDGDNDDYIGLWFGGTIEGAIRLTPMELGPYNGWNLTSVLFYHGTGSCTGMLKIYGQGTSSWPGTLISSEPYSVSEQGWLTIALSSPVTIDASQDIWVSRAATHAAGYFPLGVDAGPAVDGKGDWLYDDPVWVEMQLFSWDFNWNIRAIVTSPEEVEEETPMVPREFALRQNCPNPTFGITSISYQLPKESEVSLKLYDVRGRFVKTLVEGTRKPGYHSVTWNTCDNNGKKLKSGIYFYRLSTREEACKYIETKKLMLLR